MVHSSTTTTATTTMTTTTTIAAADPWESSLHLTSFHHALLDANDDSDEFSTVSVNEIIKPPPQQVTDDDSSSNGSCLGRRRVEFRDAPSSVHWSAVAAAVAATDLDRDEVLTQCWYSAGDYQRFSKQYRDDVRRAERECHVTTGQTLAIGYCHNVEQALKSGVIVLRRLGTSSARRPEDIRLTLVGLERSLSPVCQKDKAQRRRQVMARVLHTQTFYAVALWAHDVDTEAVAAEAIRRASLEESRTAAFTAYITAVLVASLEA